jgi:PST family polysaccharide transporter
MSLRKKMAHGVLWTFLEKFGQQFIFIGVFVVLTHLIGPEEFGLYSLCFVVVNFSMLIVYGVVDSVILHQAQDDESLSTLFWTIIGIGVTLSAVTFALSSPFAMFMNDDRLTDMLRWLCIQPALISIAAVPSGLVQARMDFRVFAIRSLISTFISGIVGITMAWKGAGAYSLIGQQIAQQLVDNLIIWPSVAWRPSLTFRGDRALNLIAPGFKMMGSSVLNFFEMNSSRLVVGFFLGPIAVGYISFVNRLWVVLREVLALPITTVLFPALAQTRDDKAETANLVDQVTFVSGLIVFPAVAGVIVTAPTFIPLFFGQQWLPTITIMQLFLAGAVIGPFMLILRDIMRAQRRTEVYFVLQLVVLVVNLAVMLALVKSGLNPLCWGLIAVAYVSFPISIVIVARLTSMPLGASFLSLWKSVLASLGMMATITGMQYLGIIPDQSGARFLWQVFIGAVVYGGLSFFLQRRHIQAGIEGLLKMRKLTV